MKIHTIDLGSFTHEVTYRTDWADWGADTFWVPKEYQNTGTRLTL